VGMHEPVKARHDLLLYAAAPERQAGEALV
jgi:hypothetical protein